MGPKSTREANSALLTAGLALTAVGAIALTFRAGVVLGTAAVVVGVGLSALFAVLTWRNRRTSSRSGASDGGRAAGPRNLQDWLPSLIGSSAVAVVGTIGTGILDPAQDRWGLLWISAPLLVASTVALLLIRRRGGEEGAPSEPDDG